MARSNLHAAAKVLFNRHLPRVNQMSLASYHQYRYETPWQGARG
jgi:hypothetical protein